MIMVSHNGGRSAGCGRRVVGVDHGERVENGTAATVFADAEKMRARHIGVSQSREMAELLKAKGFDVSGEICRYDELKAEVLQALKGGGKL